MQDCLLFSLTSGSHLTQNLLKETPLLRQAKYRLGSFIDHEVMFYLDEPVKNHPVFILGHTGPPAENLLQMYTIINTLKINGAKPIIPIIPYLGYSRSDKDKPNQPINARLFIKFLKHAGATKVITLDLHSKLDENYFTFPMTHLSMLPIMAELFKAQKIPRLDIATPDKGGIRRAQNFAKSIGKNQIIYMEKYRPSVSEAEVTKLTGTVNHKNVIIVDDMIQTGHTLLSAHTTLKAKGAQKIYATVTHSVPQSKGIKLLTSKSLFKKIIISNSIQNTIKLPNSVSIIDVSPLLAKAINNEIKQIALR
jgi:ribose-phosphate pyrophosphokinase